MVKIETTIIRYNNGDLSFKYDFYRKGLLIIMHGMYESYSNEGGLHQRIMIKHGKEIGMELTTFC